MEIETEVLLQEEYAEIYFLPNTRVVYLKVIGRWSTEEYKHSFKTLLKFTVEKKAVGVALDQTQSKGASMEGRAWLVVKWLPELKNKVKDPDFKIAGISDAKIGIKKFISDYLQGTVQKMTSFPVEVFKNLDDAVEWIVK
ncbi:MAG: hypothetical protein ACFB0B_12180 [Thermonemataceae bacterium]